MRPPLRTFLLLAALLSLAPALDAQGQPGRPPRKRAVIVQQGMTPEQAIRVLGPPREVRREGLNTLLVYPGPGGDDVVVVRDCRVVDGRFEGGERYYVVPGGRVDLSPPADGRCPGLPEPPAEVAAAPLPVAPPPAAPPAEPGPPPIVVRRPAICVPDSSRRLLVSGAPRRAPGAPMDTRPWIPAEAVRLAPIPAPRAAEETRQDAETWRDELVLRRPALRVVGVPAASISSPTAFGVDWGEGFVGVAYQQRTRYTDIDDGAVVLGFGLGDRERLAALEVALTSYSTIRGAGPLEAGGASFKLHRALGEDFGVAVGMENALEWGDNDAGTSAYAVATRVFRRTRDPEALFGSFVVSGGIGNGRFRFEDDVEDDQETVNLFGSVGVLVAEPLSLIADWNGQDLFAAASWRPVRRVPLVINAGVADLTGTAGDGARFILSAGYGFLLPF